MKKILLIIAVMAICGYSFSQAVKITPDGNVGIGTGSTTPEQKLHVVGNSYLDGNVGIGNINTNYKFYVFGSAHFGKSYDIDAGNRIYHFDNGLTIDHILESIGIAPPGGLPSNFFMFCDLYSVRNNALRIGKTSNRANIIYTYTVNYQTLVQNSDARLKQNIRFCPSFLPKLKDIKTYTYNYTDEYFKDFLPEQKEKAQKTEYGFLAQELQNIFPELVHADDSTGILSVNYVGMIPILVSAINELQQDRESKQSMAEEQQRALQKEVEALREEIEYLKISLNECCKVSQAKSMKAGEGNGSQSFNFSDRGMEEMKVYQNAPNPFNERTVISCYIPHTIQKAELCIYTMQGTRIKCLTVTERGAVELQIGAGELSTGVYTYFLIGDGTTSEAKQMILTK
ncbi:MAG: tail fiber domain-containing protein [Bacteroidales bacterium]|jgi:hypothetical protein|nr:tail fiber domain-containing protein [Bacteroidales bacterium]